MKTLILLLLVTSVFCCLSFAQEKSSKTQKSLQELQKYNEDLEHRLDVLQKKIDDVLWYERVSAVAYIDKIYITGPPSEKNFKNKNTMGVKNPIKFWNYVFIPKGIDVSAIYCYCARIPGQHWIREKSI